VALTVVPGSSNVLLVALECAAALSESTLGNHLLYDLPELSASRSVVFHVAASGARPPVSPLPGGSFSSHACVGGDAFTNRTCVFHDVCVLAGRTLYFADPARTRAAAPLAAPFELVWLDSFPLMEAPRRLVSYHLWGPHMLPLSKAGLPEKSSASAVPHLVWKPFNDDNVAHILWDNMYGMFASMSALGVLDFGTQAALRRTPLTATRAERSMQQRANMPTACM
jgi:hypothetical protein